MGRVCGLTLWGYKGGHGIHQIPKKRNERCNDGVSFSVSRLQSQEIPHVPTTSGEEERSEGMMIKKLFTVKK